MGTTRASGRRLGALWLLLGAALMSVALCPRIARAAAQITDGKEIAKALTGDEDGTGEGFSFDEASNTLTVTGKLTVPQEGDPDIRLSPERDFTIDLSGEGSTFDTGTATIMLCDKQLTVKGEGRLQGSGNAGDSIIQVGNKSKTLAPKLVFAGHNTIQQTGDMFAIYAMNGEVEVAEGASLTAQMESGAAIEAGTFADYPAKVTIAGTVENVGKPGEGHGGVGSGGTGVELLAGGECHVTSTGKVMGGHHVEQENDWLRYYQAAIIVGSQNGSEAPGKLTVDGSVTGYEDEVAIWLFAGDVTVNEGAVILGGGDRVAPAIGAGVRMNGPIADPHIAITVNNGTVADRSEAKSIGLVGKGPSAKVEVKDGDFVGDISNEGEGQAIVHAGHVKGYVAARSTGTVTVGDVGQKGPFIEKAAVALQEGKLTFNSGTALAGFGGATFRDNAKLGEGVEGKLIRVAYGEGREAVGTDPMDLTSLESGSALTVTASPDGATILMPEDATLTNETSSATVVAEGPDGARVSVGPKEGPRRTPQAGNLIPVEVKSYGFTTSAKTDSASGTEIPANSAWVTFTAPKVDGYAWEDGVVYRTTFSFGGSEVKDEDVKLVASDGAKTLTYYYTPREVEAGDYVITIDGGEAAYFEGAGAPRLSHQALDFSLSRFTFDPAGGVLDGVSVGPVFHTNLEGVLPLPSAHRSGHIFTGWSSDVAGVLTDGGYRAPVPAVEATLTAAWDSEPVNPPSSYIVTFQGNGGTWAGDASRTQSVVAGGHPDSPSGLYRDGYAFIGWYRRVNGEWSRVDVNSLYVSADVTLVAQWAKVDLTVTPSERSCALGEVVYYNATVDFTGEEVALPEWFDTAFHSRYLAVTTDPDCVIGGPYPHEGGATFSVAVPEYAGEVTIQAGYLGSWRTFALHVESEYVPSGVDKSWLADAIGKAEALEQWQWDDASWAELEDALYWARIVYDDPYATQYSVNRTWWRLEQAIEDLSWRPTDTFTYKRGLYESVERALSLKAGDYDAYSWSRLLRALQWAEDVLWNPEASQSEVDIAKTELDYAMDGLWGLDGTQGPKEPAADEPSTDEPGGAPSGSKPNQKPDEGRPWWQFWPVGDDEPQGPDSSIYDGYDPETDGTVTGDGDVDTGGKGDGGELPDETPDANGDGILEVPGGQGADANDDGSQIPDVSNHDPNFAVDLVPGGSSTGTGGAATTVVGGGQGDKGQTTVVSSGQGDGGQTVVDGTVATAEDGTTVILPKDGAAITSKLADTGVVSLSLLGFGGLSATGMIVWRRIRKGALDALDEFTGRDDEE